MIYSFANQITADLYNDIKSIHTKRFLPELHRIARRKLFYLDEAEVLSDLKIPPGNRLESLKGDLKGFYSIRINVQWRIIFKWVNNRPEEVSIIDYHK